MLEALNFVKGAVARKDFIPALQHFRIQHGRIRSFNGSMGLQSPIACDLDCAPHAQQFIRAIEACKEPVALSLTETGRLLVKSGRFKTFVDTVDPASYPAVMPEGKRVEVNESLLPALRYLEPYIATDASRPWACGIMLNYESAFAANNIVLLEYWLGFSFPARVNLPHAAIKELLRIDTDPSSVQLTDTRATFHYDSGRWLTTQLDVNPWPETEPLLNRASHQQPFPPGFFDALEAIEPFLDEYGRVYFLGSCLATNPEPDKAGTAIELAALPLQGCFNGRQLLSLKGAVDTIDFSSYPLPSIFYGPQARGIIVGIKS